MFPDIKPLFTHVERLLADFAKKDKPTIADFAAVQTLSVLYDKLDQYRIAAHQMSNAELKAEKHKSSRLADHMRRAGDPVNGCWLPRDWSDRAHMPNHLRKAVPHRRIHHTAYYGWLLERINPIMIKTSDQLIHALRLARSQLQNGAVPPRVMPRTGL